MENWFIIILAFIVIIFLLYYIKITIKFMYQRDESDDYISVDVYILKGLLAYSIQVPMIEIGDSKQLLWLKSKIQTGQSQDETHIKREQRFIKKTVKFYMLHPRRLRDVVKLVHYYARLYSQVMGGLVKNFHCEKLQWKTMYGSEDAEKTGIVTGMFWTIKELMITRLEKRIIITNNPIIHVNPIFGQNSFKVDFQCIFSMRLGNVIHAIRILYNVKR